MYQDWMEKVPVIGDIKPESIIKDNELKQQIWDLIHEYSTSLSNNRRNITNADTKIF